MTNDQKIKKSNRIGGCGKKMKVQRLPHDPTMIVISVLRTVVGAGI